MSKPIIKWVGGKRQLLPEIEKHFPKKFNKYYEPFIGGGAVFFHFSPSNAYLSDVNSELINLYRVLRDSPEELMAYLDLCNNTKEEFLTIRAFDRTEEYSKLSRVERAGRLVFLNKLCFNGLYRVNKKGQFNTPYANPKSVTFYNRRNLLASSEALQGVTLQQGDFEDTLALPVEGDFVYLDPPYAPLNSTSFTAYQEGGFGSSSQERLGKLLDSLTSREVKVLLSNSCTPYTLNLYNEYEVHEVLAKRSVNSKGSGRGPVKEIFVKNY